MTKLNNAIKRRESHAPPLPVRRRQNSSPFPPEYKADVLTVLSILPSVLILSLYESVPYMEYLYFLSPTPTIGLIPEGEKDKVQERDVR